MSKGKLSIVVIIVIGSLGSLLIFQHQTQLKQQQENQSLREQVGQIATENERLSNELAQAKPPPALTSDQLNELLRLRGEVGTLRREQKEMEKLREDNRRLQSILASSRQTT